MGIGVSILLYYLRYITLHYIQTDNISSSEVEMETPSLDAKTAKMTSFK